jgi:hypothetical protein
MLRSEPRTFLMGVPLPIAAEIDTPLLPHRERHDLGLLVIHSGPSGDPHAMPTRAKRISMGRADAIRRLNFPEYRDLIVRLLVSRSSDKRDSDGGKMADYIRPTLAAGE